jgi:uroporphyrinogen-III decarboxylase
MTSRERIIAAINHQEPDMLPVDFGGTSATGIYAGTFYELLRVLGLPRRQPYIVDMMQLLTDMNDEERRALCTDVVPLHGPSTKVGTKAIGKKPFRLSKGIEVLVAETVQFSYNEKGDCFLYPQGDTTSQASMFMPAGGTYFHAMERSPEPDYDNLNPREDFKEFGNIWTDETARHFEERAKELYENTEYAIVSVFGGAGFGDLAKVPGPTVKEPKGIRTVEDYLTAHMLYPEYIHEIYDMQCEAAVKNAGILHQAVGERIQVIHAGGTDFGMQTGLYFSKEVFQNLYKPYIKKINDYIHQHTGWKTFYHSCGSIIEILDDLIEAGVDIINPVQCSAANMDPATLKEKFGKKIVFWGGGIDTQKTLPFGTPDEIVAEVEERIRILSKSGGYVFSSIHNIIAGTPPENIIKMLEVVKKYRAA